MLLDEVVVLACHKQGRDEALVRMRDRRNVLDVEVGLLLHRAPDHPQGDAHDKGRHDDALIAAFLHHFFGKLREIGERGIQNHAGDAGIAVTEHERRCRTHAASPQRDGGNYVGRPQVSNDARKILTFVVAETDVFAVTFPRARKVECENRQAQRQQIRELRQDLHPRGGVSVHVDDDWDSVRRSFDWFPMRAFQVESSLCLQSEIRAREALSAKRECRWTEHLHLVIRSRWTNDGIHQLLVPKPCHLVVTELLLLLILRLLLASSLLLDALGGISFGP
mmetsp:Transcript_27339/g.76702  ORF Transcript_27339/g.76702 Transcript_27339/m.76702 type:complete len:279 (-) Transcript_27339:649-1485(-)